MRVLVEATALKHGLVIREMDGKRPWFVMAIGNLVVVSFTLLLSVAFW